MDVLELKTKKGIVWINRTQLGYNFNSNKILTQ